ncbi:uncharacterized protein N7515_009374 [Penicillium bovifimosum]|uniref:Cell morphogenesis protein Las1 n=1 Tax=Penicillium bovifimosum TaxID=126998 RepID=A0A9W9GJ64_9EURO|nr:uncharacterized protein N7515_009374 [Penicillium bovifimosum]KAJ5121413.1 hypothetical protein N7515_009374 [Penicillium bovifimosum]
MAKVIFTAWKSKSQLLQVRDEFYPPPTYTGPDLRSHGCAVVEAWKLRGNVPHHVEATALLTDAILHDDADRNSIFSIRATYSAAFCRFVTGLVDTKIHGVRRTMFQRATDLGLPASFVELRHEATHREPPSLIVLRKAAQRSLEWLWVNYWAFVSDDAVDGGSEEAVRAAISEALQPILAVEENKNISKKKRWERAVSVALRLVEICNGAVCGSRILANLLVEGGLLVPGDRGLGDSMTEAFKRWNPVLQKVAESHPAFLRQLTEDLVNELAFKNTDASDTIGEALYLWIAHIFTSTAWEFHRQACSQSYVLRACDESPHHWTTMLGEQVRKQAGKAKVPARSGKNRVSKVSTARNDSHYAPAQLSEKLVEFGWGYLEKWDSRPLGVVSSH